MSSTDSQSLIDQLWDFNDPAASESRFRAAVNETAEPLRRLELLTQSARAQGLQRRFDDAHATLDQVDQELHAHPDHAQFAMAQLRVALERGRVFNSSGVRDNAMALFEQAWTLARHISDDHLAVDAAHMIAIVHGAEQRGDEALAWNRRAIDIAEASTQPRARQWRASLHNNIGWTLHDRGDFSSALAAFDAALRCRIELGKPREIRIARWAVARCLRSMGRVAEALQAQQQLAREIETGGEPADGYVPEEVAECLLALGRAEESRPYFTQAHALLSRDPWLAANESNRLKRLAELARPVPVNAPDPRA